MANDKTDLIVRHPVGERVTHWAVALAFVFLFLSGLAMFHPFFYWLSQLFGSGQLMRALHPIAGVALGKASTAVPEEGFNVTGPLPKAVSMAAVSVPPETRVPAL